MKYTIKIKQLEDGFLEVRLKGYGKTWAKDLDDVGVAVSEILDCFNIIEAKYNSNKNHKKLLQ